MSALPSSVSKAWEVRKGPVILATVDNNGVPNAIYASCVSKFSEDSIVVADNYFDKTRKKYYRRKQRIYSFHCDEWQGLSNERFDRISHKRRSV